MTDKKKVSVNVAVADDGCFQITLCSGLLHKKHQVAETVESLVAKVTSFLKEELGA